MPIVATPEVGIPLPLDTNPEEVADFRAKARLMFNTVEELTRHGLDVEVTDSDRSEARLAFAAGKPVHNKIATPGSIVHLESILTEWDHEVLDVSRRLRNYITNRFIIESTDEDPRIRLKALENLGRLSNVGLFNDRVDITVTHRSISDIETDLKRTLELFSGEVIDVTPLESEIKRASVAELDLDAEFGTAQVHEGPTQVHEGASLDVERLSDA